MDTNLILREKIKNKDSYLSSFNVLRRRSNKISLYSSFLASSLVLIPSALLVFSAPLDFIAIPPILTFAAVLAISFSFAISLALFVYTLCSIFNNKWDDGKIILLNLFDASDGFKSSYFLSGNFWKKNTNLSGFDSYKDAVVFFENCEPLDENSVINTLKSVYEFSLEETDLFKECLVYREKLGYWSKKLLKMGAEIDKAKLNTYKVEISSLEGLNFNAKTIELECLIQNKAEVDLKKSKTSQQIESIKK